MPKPKVVNKVETLGFVNPTIVKPAKGEEFLPATDEEMSVEGFTPEPNPDYVPESRMKSPRGWQITTSEKYPVNRFDAMLLKLAEDNGGSARLNIEVSINLNSNKSDEPLDTDGIELLA